MTDAETLREIRELLIDLDYKQQTIVGGKITIQRGDEARKFERVLKLVLEWGGDGIAEQARTAAEWLSKNTAVSVLHYPASRSIWRLSNQIGWVDYFTNAELMRLAQEKGWGGTRE
jgi:hypothetical protein